MNVVLLSPPYVKEYMRNARCDFISLSKTQWYPIWLGYCGAFLESKGHKVRLIDAPSYGLSHKETEDLIYDFAPDFIVIYSGRMSEDNDIEFAERVASKLQVRAVFVGPFASINPEKLLKKCKTIQAVIKGEFEFPVLELVEARNYRQILNLIYKTESDDIVVNPVRPFLSTDQLDAIPFVTDFFHRHIDFKHYKAPSEYHPFIDLMTGRGCIWGLCSFCLWVHSFIPGQVYNERSVGNVVEEFRFVQKYIPRIRSIMLQDDTLPEDRAIELSEAFLNFQISLPWSCYARANMGSEALKLMKRAGCRNLHVGYETSSLQALKNVKKGISVERMTQFSRDAKRAGLRIHADFAIGFDGETAESIEKTIKWAKQLDPDTAQFQLMIPYPGTPYYERLKSKGWLLNGEPDYPELTNEEMRKWAKRAYREFYLSLRYLKKAIKHPYEHFLSRLDTISKAIPAMFWKRW